MRLLNSESWRGARGRPAGDWIPSRRPGGMQPQVRPCTDETQVYTFGLQGVYFLTMTLKDVLRGKQLRVVRAGAFEFTMPENPITAGAIGLLCAGGGPVLTRIMVDSTPEPTVASAFAQDQTALTGDMYRAVGRAATLTRVPIQAALVASVDEYSAD